MPRTAAQHEEAVLLAVDAAGDEALVLRVLARVRQPRRHPAADLHTMENALQGCAR